MSLGRQNIVTTIFQLQASPKIYFSNREAEGRKVQRDPGFMPAVYSFDQLNSLLGDLARAERRDSFSSDLSDADLFCLRFVLLVNGAMLLASDGIPGRRNTIAGHRDMASSCIAAGELFFDQDEASRDFRLVAIRNKSGAFQPALQSLQFAAFMLLREGLLFGENVQIRDELSAVNIISLENLKLNLYSLMLSDVTVPRAATNYLPPRPPVVLESEVTAGSKRRNSEDDARSSPRFHLPPMLPRYSPATSPSGSPVRAAACDRSFYSPQSEPLGSSLFSPVKGRRQLGKANALPKNLFGSDSDDNKENKQNISTPKKR